MDLKAGDVFFIMHEKNVISKMIAWAMGSKWSHCGVILGEYRNDYITCETTDFEIALKTFGLYLAANFIEIEVLRPIEDYSETELFDLNQTAFSFQGQIYGYLQLFSLGIRRLLMRLKIKISNFINVNKVCCAVVIALLSTTKKSLKIVPTSIDTEELYQKLKTRAGKQSFTQ